MVKASQKASFAFAFILLASFFVSCLSLGEVKKTLLNNNWNMQIVSGHQESNKFQQKLYNTSVPTVVHLDMLSEGDIADPFLEDNYQKLKWVSESNVKYSTKFSLDSDTLKLSNHRIVFEGIDTYADILLNGEKLLSTENAFREYSVLIGGLLKEGENSLEVYINSTMEWDKNGQRANQMPFEYAHTRKACYQYSWDWAPYLNTMGIWKEVYIESYDDVQIDYVWARNRYISEKKAIINFAVALQISAESDKEALQKGFSVSVKFDGKTLAKKPITDKNMYLDVEIDSPRLWWPNGIGQSYLYDFQVSLQKQSQQASLAVDVHKVPYGIRTVKLDQTNNQFTVIVNGYPVYAKGANYVPPDMFYPRLSNPRYSPGNTIEHILDDAVDSHFNMIRLWGGGQYESNEFFQMASRKGIMIFYDFMFSDSVYPSTEQFLVNVEEEVKQQIRRVRNYPCLALWSGNNEILQGINDWGWSSANYKDDFKKLFETLIPKIIEIENPEISYIASSPVNGVGNYNFQRGGDFHYWGVWAGGANFESYKTAVGPFNSEFGTQALPVWETICQTVQEKDRNYESQVLLSHERHGSRFGTLQKYMTEYMRKAGNFELQTYQSGLLQAYAIEVAIKAQRAAKPKSQGTLYWQMNDAWPAISWSSIDYFGRWKPLQFMAKRLFPDIAVFYTEEYGVTVISDKLYPTEVMLIVQLITFDGEVLVNETQNVKLAANEVKKVELGDVLKSKVSGNEARAVLYTEVVGGRKEVMSSTHFFKRFKELELPEGQLKVQYHPEFQEITLSSDKVLKNVYIGNSKEYVKTSDNYFDLIPGHPVKVELLSKKPLSELIETMTYRSYRQVYQKDPLKVIL